MADDAHTSAKNMGKIRDSQGTLSSKHLPYPQRHKRRKESNAIEAYLTNKHMDEDYRQAYISKTPRPHRKAQNNIQQLSRLQEIPLMNDSSLRDGTTHTNTEIQARESTRVIHRSTQSLRQYQEKLTVRATLTIRIPY